MGGTLRKDSAPTAFATPKIRAGKSAVVVTEKDRTILELKATLRTIRKYQRGLEDACLALLERAKLLAALSQRKNALGLMRLRAHKLQQIDTLEMQLGNIQKSIEQVEMAEINKDVFDCLSQGDKILKLLNDEMPMEEIERILQDTREAVDMQNDISALLGSRFSYLNQEVLEKQLVDLMQQEAPLHSQVHPTLPMPSVPSLPVQVVSGARRGKNVATTEVKTRTAMPN